jgi:hypothetical protein
MTKPLTSEQKDERATERAATKGKATARTPVTIETAIKDLTDKFSSYIRNVGDGTFLEMVQEIRKLQKEGTFEDSVDAVIQLKLGKEGLKLTLGAKSNVTKKTSHKEDWGAIVSDPVQPYLPGIKKDAKGKNGKSENACTTIEAGEVGDPPEEIGGPEWPESSQNAQEGTANAQERALEP